MVRVSVAPAHEPLDERAGQVIFGEHGAERTGRLRRSRNGPEGPGCATD